MRPFLASLCALLMASAAFGENQRPHLTITGGVVGSELRDVTADFRPFEPIKAFEGGVGLALPFASGFEIEPRVTFTEKGISLGEFKRYDVYGQPTGTFETFLVQGDLEVPVLLRWNILRDGRVHPVIEGGPFAAFELSERTKFTGAVRASGHTSDLKNTDWGFVLGAGLGIDVGPGRWLLEGHYEPGIQDLGAFFGTVQVHSNAFVVSTGYRY